MQRFILFNKHVPLPKPAKFVPAANTLGPSPSGVAKLFGEPLALPNLSVVYLTVIQESRLKKA